MRFTHCAVAIALVLLSFTSVAAAPRKTVQTKSAPILLPRTKVNALGALVPDVHAAAAVVLNPDTNEVLWSENAEEVRSIASVTKVMTASVVLEDDPDLSEMVAIQPMDVLRASHTFLRAHDRVSKNDLLHLMLIASDNVAARALARVSNVDGVYGFVRRMNEKAMEMTLWNTSFADPAGLLSNNYSTALETVRLMINVSQDDRITTIMQQTSYTMHFGKRTIVAPSTDRLLGKVDIVAAKTGYTTPAGYCLVTLVRQESGQVVAIAVLGARTNADRFIEIQNLAKWLEKAQVADNTDCGPTPMHISMGGADFIKYHENFYARAYKDSGGWAIGYGMHSWKGKRVTSIYPKLVTQAQANDEFTVQIRQYEDIVRSSVCAPLSQSGFDALVSIAWNLGRVNNDIIRKLANGRALLLADFTSTATVRNKPNWMLEARRTREFLLYTGDYDAAMNTHVRNQGDVRALMQEVRLLSIDNNR